MQHTLKISRKIDYGLRAMIFLASSAPEAVVQKCVGLLQERFGASVETRVICQEDLRFSLPKL